MRHGSRLASWALLLSLAFFVVCCAKGARAETTCTESLQKQIDATPSGGVVYAKACIYREKVTISKPITLDGGGQAEIRGSDVWAASRFAALNNGTWKATNYPNLPAIVDAKCEPNTGRCKWPEQVYYDGQPLMQVAPSVTPQGMQFAVNSDHDLIVGADPSGQLVEVTVRDGWVTGGKGAGGVTVRGFEMKHASDRGLSNKLGSNWTVRDNDLSYAHTSNLLLTGATGLLALDNEIHHGGQKGVAGNDTDLTLQGNEIYENNSEGYNTSWNAGGVKISNPHNVTFAGNTVYGNHGNALWLDVPTDDQDVVVRDNRVHHNDGHGIRVEVTTNVEIFGNKVWENGWPGDGGITVGASSDVSVHDNIVAWNESGISIFNPLRTDKHSDEDYYDYVRNNLVASNTIVMENHQDGRALGWVKQWSGGNIHNSAANNSGRDNRYYYPTTEGSTKRYRWTEKYTNLAAFNATPGEERGTYMSTAEKDSVLQQAGIPTRPEPH